MKKYVFHALSLLFIVFALPFFAIGQSSGSTINPKDYGQSHSYSVLLRGNSEAVVWSTIQITNGAETPVSQLVLKTGNLTPRLFEAWQEVENISASTPARCINRASTSTTESLVVVRDQAECRLLFGNNFSYHSPISGTREYSYNKLNVQQSGKTVTAALSQKINKDSKGTIIISYRGFGAVNKGLFGKMQFDFQTLETTDRIRSINVVANVDTDLYIKGDKAQVSYVEEAPEIFSSSGVGMQGAMSTAGMVPEPMSYKIGREKTTTSVTKSTSDLLAGDVFHVRGIYASSWLGMYWTKIAIFIIIIATIIIAIILGMRFWRIRHPKGTNLAGGDSSQISSANQAKTYSWWSAVIIGFLNAVGTIMLAFVTPFMVNLFEDMMRYNESGISLAFMILFPLAGIILYGAMLFTPAIYFGNRYGRGYGFIVFGSQLGFLFLITFMYIWMIYVLSGSGRFRPYY